MIADCDLYFFDVRLHQFASYLLVWVRQFIGGWMNVLRTQNIVHCTLPNLNLMWHLLSFQCYFIHVIPLIWPVRIMVVLAIWILILHRSIRLAFNEMVKSNFFQFTTTAIHILATSNPPPLSHVDCKSPHYRFMVVNTKFTQRKNMLDGW